MSGFGDTGLLIGVPGQMLAVRVPTGHVSRCASAVPSVPRYAALSSRGLGVVVCRGSVFPVG